MMVRFGFQPDLTNSPRDRASSRMATCPEMGSSAPFTHPSWWLPRITHSSGKTEPGIFPDHVVQRLDVPVRFHFEVNFRGAGADVIGDAEAAAPSFRSHSAGQRSKKRLRIGIGYRSTGILVIVGASSTFSRLASLVAPTPGVSGSPG